MNKDRDESVGVWKIMIGNYFGRLMEKKLTHTHLRGFMRHFRRR